MVRISLVEKKNGARPRPQLRFCRDSIVLLFYGNVCDNYQLYDNYNKGKV